MKIFGSVLAIIAICIIGVAVYYKVPSVHNWAINTFGNDIQKAELNYKQIAELLVSAQLQFNQMQAKVNNLGQKYKADYSKFIAVRDAYKSNYSTSMTLKSMITILGVKETVEQALNDMKEMNNIITNEVNIWNLEKKSLTDFRSKITDLSNDLLKVKNKILSLRISKTDSKYNALMDKMNKTLAISEAMEGKTDNLINNSPFVKYKYPNGNSTNLYKNLHVPVPTH